MRCWDKVHKENKGKENKGKENKGKEKQEKCQHVL
jgi:hypothetical protein